MLFLWSQKHALQTGSIKKQKKKVNNCSTFMNMRKDQEYTKSLCLKIKGEKNMSPKFSRRMFVRYLSLRFSAQGRPEFRLIAGFRISFSQFSLTKVNAFPIFRALCYF